MKDRILQLMKSEGMSQQEFSKATGIAPASLSSIFNGRTAPTMKHAEAMHRYFPRLSMAWLLFGEGEMFTLTDEEMASRTRVGEDNEGTESASDGVPGTEGWGLNAARHPAADPSGGYVGDLFSQQPSGTPQAPYGAPVGGVRSRDAHGAAEKGQNTPLGVPSGYPPFYPGMAEMVKYPDIKQRKIVEIRIFFDDGTFETFQGN